MKKSTLLLFMSMLLIVGCSTIDFSEYRCFDSPELIKFENNLEIFDDISLKLYDGENYSYNSGNSVLVGNLSSTNIWFPKGFNSIIKIIDKDGTKKVVEDIINRVGDHDYILTTKGLEGSIVFFVFYPELNDDGFEKEIEITVFGYGFRDNKYCEDIHQGKIRLTLFP